MDASEAFLESAAWASILEQGLDANSFVRCPGAGRLTTSWTIFARIGIRAAYANFPVGFDRDDGRFLHELPEALQCLRKAGVDLARFSIVGESGIPGMDRHHVVDLPETCIESLAGWSEASIATAAQRKIRKSRADGLVVRDACKGDGDLLYDAYAETISRRHGHYRYTRNYFARLCELAAVDERLSIGIAAGPDRLPCGFIAVAHCGSSSYYLHGGFLSRARSLRPGYSSMAWAINRSQLVGSTRFNMLTSPREQPSLVAYKESFGGTSYLRRHYDVPLTAKGVLVQGGLRAQSALGRMFLGAGRTS